MTKDEAVSVLNKINDLFGAEYENTSSMIAIEMAIEALKEKYWISIKEKMPDKLGEYLVQTENVKPPFSAWYEGNNIWTDSPGIETERVLAWRELPVSYRERDYD